MNQSLSNLSSETAAEIQRIESGAELNGVAQLINELADAQKADKEAKLKARETGKAAKRKAEMLREVLRPYATQKEVVLPELHLEPIDPKIFLPVLKETSAFFVTRAKNCPQRGEHLQTFWRYGLQRLPSWVEERRRECRDSRSIYFIISDWQRDMIDGAWQITEWR